MTSILLHFFASTGKPINQCQQLARRKIFSFIGCRIGGGLRRKLLIEVYAHVTSSSIFSENIEIDVESMWIGRNWRQTPAIFYRMRRRTTTQDMWTNNARNKSCQTSRCLVQTNTVNGKDAMTVYRHCDSMVCVSYFCRISLPIYIIQPLCIVGGRSVGGVQGTIWHFVIFVLFPCLNKVANFSIIYVLGTCLNSDREEYLSTLVTHLAHNVDTQFAWI